MRVTLSSVVTIFTFALLVGIAQAVPVVTIKDGTQYSGGPDTGGSAFNYVTAPGTGAWNFDIVVEITTDVSLVSAQFFIRDLSHSGLVTINSLAWNTALWDSGSALSFSTPQTLDSGNSYTSEEIGTLANDLVNGTGTGTFTFVTLNITVANSLGGTFVLQLTDLVFGDTGFNDAGAVAGNTYDISVVPAPGAFVLGAMGLGLVGWLKRRRHVA